MEEETYIKTKMNCVECNKMTNVSDMISLNCRIHFRCHACVYNKPNNHYDTVYGCPEIHKVNIELDEYEKQRKEEIKKMYEKYETSSN